ncbi:MAG: hypothetical protein HRT71_13680 [Flavobacteriales bacterium]|nr:hypothetical protein [Flavobacteriales bacterium]
MISNPNESQSAKNSKYKTSTFSYDAFGNVLTEVASSVGLTGTTVTYKYDADGRFRTEKTNALGQTSKTSHHPFWGKPVSATNIVGHKSTFEYDELGRLIISVNRKGHQAVTTRSWDFNDDPGLPSPIVEGKTVYTVSSSKIGMPSGKTWFDRFGREVKTQAEGVNQQLIYQVAAYDARGNNFANSSPFFADGTSNPFVSTTYYDDRNRVTSTVAGPNITTFDYELVSGHLESFSNSPDGWKRVITDASGVVLSSEDEGGKLEYKYTSKGLQRRVTLAGTELASMEFDMNGNQTLLIDVNAGEISYLYNGFNQLVKQTETTGDKTMEYDVARRVILSTSPGENITYEYETENNGLNLLKSETEDRNGYSKSYIYDEYSRLVKVKENIDTEVFTSGFVCDEFDRMVMQTFPSGLEIENVYDEKGYLEKKLLGDIEIFYSPNINEQGQLTSYENGAHTTILTYGRYGNLERKKVGSIFNMQYDFDLATGNLLSRVDDVNNLTEYFTYGDLNRLETSDVMASSSYLSIVYNDNGNIESKSDAGTYTYDANKINAVIDITGGPNPLPQQDIVYNSHKRVTEIGEGDALLKYAYGSGGQRKKAVLKSFGATVKIKYYGRNYEKVIKNSDTTEITYVGGPDGLLGMWIIENGQGNWYYTITDYLGSILQVVNEGDSLVAEQNFNAWGRCRNVDDWTYEEIPTTNPDWLTRGFTGHEHLRGFGLINMNARMYDPIVARMMGTDNFVQTRHGTQGFNRYTYGLNNPLKYTDPSGESLIVASLILGGIAGGYIGGAAVNNGELNPFKWDPNLRTLGGILAGGTIGIGGGYIFATLGPAIAGNAALGTGLAGVFGTSGTVSAYVITGLISGGLGGYGAGFAGGMLQKGASLSSAHQWGMFGGKLGLAFGGSLGTLYGIDEVTVSRGEKRKVFLNEFETELRSEFGDDVFEATNFKTLRGKRATSHLGFTVAHLSLLGTGDLLRSDRQTVYLNGALINWFYYGNYSEYEYSLLKGTLFHEYFHSWELYNGLPFKEFYSDKYFDYENDPTERRAYEYEYINFGTGGDYLGIDW